MQVWLARNPIIVDLDGKTTMSGCGDHVVVIVIAKSQKEAIAIFNNRERKLHFGFVEDISKWNWQLLGQAKDQTPRVEVMIYACGPEDKFYGH